MSVVWRRRGAVGDPYAGCGTSRIGAGISRQGRSPTGEEGMSKELIVSATRHETRVAILEDDQLVEIFHQREQEYSLAGSIHKGRVTRVLPGMQSAFVDIGLERDAFLYVSDFFEDNEEYDKVVSSVEEKVLKLDKTPSDRLPPARTSSPDDRSAPVELTSSLAAPLEDDLDLIADSADETIEPVAIESAAAETRTVEPRPDRE